MFVRMKAEKIKEIKERLEKELEEKDLPLHRRTEVESLIYYADAWIREKNKIEEGK